MNEIVTLDVLKERIFTIRNKRVMIDRDLAELYGVSTKKLNQAVKRNIMRFPSDFMFQLTDKEQNELVAKCDQFEKLKHSKTNSYAFTEHGVTMLSSVLRSKKAVEINIQVVRAFVALRQFAIENKELSNRLAELEHYFIQHCEENRVDIKEINKTLSLLIDRTKPGEIGFKTK